MKPNKIPVPIARIVSSFARDTRHILDDNLIAQYLFGSYTAHAQTAMSDIDILIIVHHFTPELQWQMSGLAVEYSLKYDVCISPIVKDLQVWEKNQQHQTLFYQNIVNQGLLI